MIRQNADSQKESPIADVQIQAATTLSAGDCKSDASGFFNLTLRPGIVPWDSVTIQFRHPEYLPLDLNVPAEDKLYVIRMVPIPAQNRTQPSTPDKLVANVSARYSIKATSAANIGNAVKTFQVINTGNVPCPTSSPARSTENGKPQSVLLFSTPERETSSEMPGSPVLRDRVLSQRWNPTVFPGVDEPLRHLPEIGPTRLLSC